MSSSSVVKSDPSMVTESPVPDARSIGQLIVPHETMVVPAPATSIWMVTSSWPLKPVTLIAVVFVTVARVVLHGAAVVLAPFTRTTPDAFWLKTMLSPLDRAIESVPPLNVHDEIASADRASTIARAWNVISAPTVTRAAERRPRPFPRARKLIRFFLLSGVRSNPAAPLLHEPEGKSAGPYPGDSTSAIPVR